MNLNSLYEMIYKRRSVRKYEKAPLDDALKEKILSDVSELRPLYPDIKTELRFFTKSEVRSLMPWMPEDAIGIYSETKDGYLENAGFILAVLDLYLQSIGLGACWVGLAGPKVKGLAGELEFVILLAVGKTDVPERSGVADFKRKDMSEITDSPDKLSELLAPARLAASSVNSQPWYFVGGDGEIDVYQRDLVRTKGLRRMNRIDVGIALAHLFLSTPDSFAVYVKGDVPERDGMTYITTVRNG